MQEAEILKVTRLFLLPGRKVLGCYNKIHARLGPETLEVESAHLLIQTQLCPVYTSDNSLDRAGAYGMRAWQIICKVSSIGPAEVLVSETFLR